MQQTILKTDILNILHEQWALHSIKPKCFSSWLELTPISVSIWYRIIQVNTAVGAWDVEITWSVTKIACPSKCSICHTATANLFYLVNDKHQSSIFMLMKISDSAISSDLKMLTFSARKTSLEYLGRNEVLILNSYQQTTFAKPATGHGSSLKKDSLSIGIHAVTPCKYTDFNI